MTDALWERVESYAHSALTGILANPSYNNPNSQAWMNAKNLNPEKLAILSAIEIVQQLEIFKLAQKNVDDKKPALVT